MAYCLALVSGAVSEVRVYVGDVNPTSTAPVTGLAGAKGIKASMRLVGINPASVAGGLTEILSRRDESGYI
jgi:hypothetical protein